MNKIESYKQIQELFIRIRAYKEGFITNFFIGEERCNLLIDKNLLFLSEYEKCCLIFYKEEVFFHLYFLSVNNDRLSIALKDFFNKNFNITFVTDIIGSDTVVAEFSALLESCGFEKYTKLIRMNRLTEENPSDIVPDPRIEYATLEWMNQIKNILNEHFDTYSEQIPLLEEIEQWIKDKRIIGILDRKKIIGLVIFEIIGMTSHLRYWFVDPEHRNKKIGSALLRRFFYECRNTKRELFWVVTKNENAIVRYEHYGFKPEQLFDQVFIKQHK
jgi:GNAT superfamily N-acetyltransferase